MQRFNFSNKSFTLLELIIVIIIIGVLTSLALPKLFVQIKRVKAMEAISTFGSLRAAFDRCLLMHDLDFMELGGQSFAKVHSACGNFDALGVDDPSSNPGAHFTYNNSVEFVAIGNTFAYVFACWDNTGNSDDWIYLIVTHDANLQVRITKFLPDVWVAPQGKDGVYIVGFGNYKGIVTKEGYH